MIHTRESAGFLAAVLADPHDNVARLSFADWCEESGCSARGELIRVQCAIADAPSPPTNNYVCRCLDLNPTCKGCQAILDWNAKWGVLAEREAELFQANERDELLGFTIDDCAFIAEHCPEMVGFLRAGADRGFLGKLRMRAVTWVNLSWRLMARFPIVEVLLTTEPLLDLRHGMPGDPLRVRFASMPDSKWVAVDNGGFRPTWLKVCESTWPGITFRQRFASSAPAVAGGIGGATGGEGGAVTLVGGASGRSVRGDGTVLPGDTLVDVMRMFGVDGTDGLPNERVLNFYDGSIHRYDANPVVFAESGIHVLEVSIVSGGPGASVEVTGISGLTYAGRLLGESAYCRYVNPVFDAGGLRIRNVGSVPTTCRVFATGRRN